MGNPLLLPGESIVCGGKRLWSAFTAVFFVKPCGVLGNIFGRPSRRFAPFGAKPRGAYYNSSSGPF